MYNCSTYLLYLICLTEVCHYIFEQFINLTIRHITVDTSGKYLSTNLKLVYGDLLINLFARLRSLFLSISTLSRCYCMTKFKSKVR